MLSGITGWGGCAGILMTSTISRMKLRQRMAAGAASIFQAERDDDMTDLRRAP